MKIIYKTLILGFIFLFASCGSNNKEGKIKPSDIKNPNTAQGVDKKVEKEMAKIEFEKDYHDFGKVVDGVKISYAFKFKNTGGSDLIIHTVNSSCGCTASEFTKEPVPPGGSGVVKLTFDSSRRPGENTKTATIVANTQPNVTTLRIHATVIKANQI